MLGSLAAQTVKNLPATQEPGVQSQGQEDRGQQRKRWLDGIADSTDMSVSTLWETVKTEQAGVQWSMGSQSRTQLSD